MSSMALIGIAKLLDGLPAANNGHETRGTIMNIACTTIHVAIRVSA